MPFHQPKLLLVQFPGWNYPAVIDVGSGEVRFDNYEGAWGDRAHLDTGLLRDLADHRLLEALPRVDEAGQRGVATLRPVRVSAEEAAVVRRLAVDDDHDHRRVGARELGAAAHRAPQLVPGVARLEGAAAPRAVSRGPVPLGDPDGVHEQLGVLLVDGLDGATQPGPAVLPGGH